MLSSRLKYARQKKKLTQEELAKKVGTTKGTISNYENEYSSPSNDMLKDLATILDVTTDFLLGTTDNPNEKYNQTKTDILSDNKVGEYTIDQLHAFSFRLRQGLKDSNVSIDDAADKCNVTNDYIQKLMNKPNKLPGISTLYKLAELIDVTPDYLGGFTDDPDGFDTRTPRPKDMQEFLENEEVMFQGNILDDEDKEKIQNVLSAVFMDAKKRNKRRR